MSNWLQDRKHKTFQRIRLDRHYAEFHTIDDALDAVRTVYKKVGPRLFLDGPVVIDYRGGAEGIKVSFHLGADLLRSVRFARLKDRYDPSKLFHHDDVQAEATQPAAPDAAEKE